jgi:hypothetical protein
VNKKEKEKIKDSRPSGVMSEEEWAKVQGMTHSEFHTPTKIKDFYEKVEKSKK